MPKEIFEKMAGAPAQVLDKTIETSKKMAKTVTEQKTLKKAREYWDRLGPGLTTGAADDDPSGVATYSQAGAGYGFRFLWLAPFTFPLMAVVQEMCARIGLVTGRGLAANIRLYFPRWVIYLCAGLLFLANSFNIGADLGAMAKAVQLIWPKANFALLLIIFTIIILGLQIFTTYKKYAYWLKWLALILLVYVLTAFAIPNFDWNSLPEKSLIPSLGFSMGEILIVCAVIGTTISPYLFFWQTSQEVEEQIMEGKTTLKLRQEETTNDEIKNMRIDVWSGMFLSNLVMFFIIAVSAATLFNEGVVDIQTAAQAASALKPLAGEKAFLLFTLGIIGTGLIAVPILAGSASYALSESFGWRYGLYRKLKEAYSFYGVIIISILIGLSINFLNINPIKALIYSAIVNGLIAPVILVLIILMSGSPKIMGRWVNGTATKIFGWGTTALVSIVGLAVIAAFFKRLL